MKRTRTLRIWGGFLLLLLLLLVFLIWNIFAGSVSLSASEIWRILRGSDAGFTQSQSIMKIRLPRLLSALILGGDVYKRQILRQSGRRFGKKYSGSMRTFSPTGAPIWAAKRTSTTA